MLNVKSIVLFVVFFMPLNVSCDLLLEDILLRQKSTTGISVWIEYIIEDVFYTPSQKQSLVGIILKAIFDDSILFFSERFNVLSRVLGNDELLDSLLVWINEYGNDTALIILVNITLSLSYQDKDLNYSDITRQINFYNDYF